MDKPLFSVLIANYNNLRYLEEAIKSVLAQSYDSWEIILVDDASTDNPDDYYRALSKDPRIHIFYNDTNRGCAFTKHQCVLKAHGEYCGYLDPDDVLLPNAIECMVNALVESPDVVLTFSRHYLCDEKLNKLEESRLLLLKDGESYFEHHDYRAEVFAGFRKSAYIQAGGLDINNRRGVDADLYFRLEEQGRIKILNEFTYLYRRTPDSLVSDIEKNTYWNLWVRHNTCLRRGLPIEQYSFADFHAFIQLMTSIKMSQNEQALSSKAYKLGKMILRPFSIFKH